MSLVEAVVGCVSGTVTRWFAGFAAIVALPLAILGLAAPPAFFDLVDPVLSVYAGNELLFLSGYLFAVGHRRWSDSNARAPRNSSDDRLGGKPRP